MLAIAKMDYYVAGVEDRVLVSQVWVTVPARSKRRMKKTLIPRLALLLFSFCCPPLFLAGRAIWARIV